MKLSAMVFLRRGSLTPSHPSTKQDPMERGNYKIVMIGHIMSKIYASVLDGKVNGSAKAHGLRVDGHARFRTDHVTLDHILTLRGIL